ncbi:MAG: hypothetical protein CVV50_03760 [Spirochaetae bacterium HGW-Spirochaetae-6]|nr:MAG: hypothetical protein CVV50_03760 [Spirochaetae bacterium HGW-Spirochaetae-6]
MRSAQSEIIINEESYLLFSELLHGFIQKNTGDLKQLLTSLKRLVFQNDSYIENFWYNFRKLERENKIDALLKGIIFYFVAKIYSRRKEFSLSLNLLEQAEQLLAPLVEEAVMALRKEIHILKMAYHYTEN